MTATRPLILRGMHTSTELEPEPHDRDFVVMIPRSAYAVQSPSQASSSGNLKRGRDHQESEKEEDEDKKDEARTSPSPAKRAGLALGGSDAKVVPNLNVASALSDTTTGLCFVTAASTEDQAKQIASRSRGEGKAL
ncbi:MAG: hypothetical protein Q9215_006097 [Flavoplaca cf. flavocitrina]